MAEESVVAAESFPPKFVQDLAISRDDRVLALVASDSVSQSVKFYDFAANNFSNETQLKGMVADYRMQSLDLTNSAVIPGLSHKETTGVKLKDAITSNESAWTSIKDYPANYNESGVSDLRVGTDKRFFGYYSSYTKDGTLSPVKSFATAIKGKSAFFCDYSTIMQNSLVSHTPFVDNFRINNNNAHESFIQFSQAGKGELIQKRFRARNDATALPGWDNIKDNLTPSADLQINSQNYTIDNIPTGFKDENFNAHYYVVGKPFEFNLSLPGPGPVNVDLLFCEIHFNDTDERKFNIYIEGEKRESDFDVYAEAGGKNKALLRSYLTNVLDTQLTVKFEKKIICMISGIRVSYLMMFRLHKMAEYSRRLI
ncbi:MAG: malectin domain-containing carbohydrate-binding protein [Candidatus Ozemobacteraceae bacterium]